MDIQVLNEIASLARQSSLSRVSASVSANAQLKGLKGNPAPALESSAPPALEGSPEQAQAPVAPEISSVARAASAYSAAVGDGLNSDELIAIQDLAGKVRSAVSDFLSQPGLEQAENAATVVVSNPEAVQDLTESVEQAVVATLNLPGLKGEVIVNATPPNTDALEEIPAPKNQISLERITKGAESNNPAQVVAASPAVQNAQAGDHARVETPVSRPEPIVSPQPESVSRVETIPASPQETPVIAASPALAHSRANENTSVENPVTVEAGVETSNRDFTVTAASPAVQNAQAGDHARVETPVSRPEPIVSPQPESVSRPEAVAVPQQDSVHRAETVSTNPQETPVIAASPALAHSRANENTSVENPVTVEAGAATSNRDFTVTAASPAVQNAQAGDHARVETPVSRLEPIVSPQPESVSRVETIPASPQEAPVIAASPAVQDTQAQNAGVGNPVNIPAPSANQGQGSEGPQAQPVSHEATVVPPAGASSQAVEGQSDSQAVPHSQPASVPQPGPAQSSDLFAQGNAAVNPENIRDVNELVNSVVDNEFTSEAKKIFSQPKVIRTVADLADFILERLREIIAAQQQQSQSSGEVGLS